MDAERCVCCGDVIPEGRQVCVSCESGETSSTYKYANIPTQDIVDALICSATPGNLTICKGRDCPFYSEEYSEDWERLTGQKEMIGCNVDEISMAAAHRLKMYDIQEKIIDTERGMR